MSHIENHILLETDLRLLYEFNQEAHSETSDKEGTEEEAPVNLVGLVSVKRKQQEAEDEIGEGLIELGRMLWHGLTPEFEDKAPGQGGLIAVNLRVEEISESDHASGERDCDAEAVNDPEEIHIAFLPVLAGIPPHSQQQGYCSAVACKAALPRHEYLQEALPGSKIIIRLIEEAVAKSGADDGSDEHHAKQGIHKLEVCLFAGEEPLEEVPANNESRCKKQGVPPYLKVSDMEKHRVHVPVHKKHVKHINTFYRANISIIAENRKNDGSKVSRDRVIATASPRMAAEYSL